MTDPICGETLDRESFGTHSSAIKAHPRLQKCAFLKEPRSLYSSVVQADSRSSSSTSTARCCPNISSRTRTRPVLDIGRSNAASSPASGP